MLPGATFTFLFTDIEGSTRLWEMHPEAMKAVLARHDAILRAAVLDNHGQIVKHTGDGLHGGFASSLDAVRATLSAQRQFQSPLDGLLIKVRMGLHTGEAEWRAGDYYGPAVNRAARLMSAAHGGQILLSGTTAELVRGLLEPGTSLLDLGEHRLKDLAYPEHIYQIFQPPLQAEFPPIKSLDSYPNNLPIQLTSFIGREKEIAEIRSMLKQARLVTLTGSGGTGKTRLALETGAEELASFAHGVWEVELASLSDPAQIIPAIAQVFGLQELPFISLAAQVTNYLREKKLLLILDNCEHLIEACAAHADELLHHCAGLKIIASSREALGIAGEMAYRIPSLVEDEATRLFVERARAANPKFELTGANALPVARICSRLDGIPLAIELAASRSRLLTAEQIAARLDDRFRLLVGGSRTALPRQQTLRALIDWSYDLLSDEEKRTLQFASVFVGGWTLEALEAVAEGPNILELLQQLINKSLAVAEERGGEMRYFLLETIRQYAREKLFSENRAASARDRHFIYFDRLSEEIWAGFHSAHEFIKWRSRAEEDAENLRTALEWGLESHVEDALHMAANYCAISSWMGGVKAALVFLYSALERVRALPPVEGEPALRRQKNIAAALFSEGNAVMLQGNNLRACEAFTEAAAISRATGDKRILGYSLVMYFIAAEFTQKPGGPEAAQEGLAVLTELGDEWGLATANLNMARIATHRGDLEARRAYLAKNQAYWKDSPLSFQSAMSYLSLGMEERIRRNHQAARPYFEEGLIAFKKLGNKNFENVMRSELGHIARLDGDFAQAKVIYTQTLLAWQDLGHQAAIAHQLECFAFIAMDEHEPLRAARLLGAAEALRERNGSPMAKYEETEYQNHTARLQSMLSGSELEPAWAEGRALSMEQAILLALS